MVKIFEYTVLICIIFLCLWSVYHMGVQKGSHRERTRLLNIINDLCTSNSYKRSLPEQKMHVAYVINYIINRVREG